MLYTHFKIYNNSMKKLFLLLLPCAIFFTSCGSGFSLQNSDVLNHADFTQFKTFTVIEPSMDQLPEFMSKIDFENIATAISTELEQRGFTRVKNSPDMIVNFGISSRQKIETKDAIPTAAPMHYRFMGPRTAYLDSYYSDAKVISDIYQEGLLTVDMVDARKNVHIFNATISAVTDQSGTNVKDLEKLQAAADVLFSKFPVSEITK